MSKTVEFFYDVGSPASYLAWTQLGTICRAQGATQTSRPMLLGGVFQATGNFSPANIAAKGKYMNVDLQRHAERYGVPFTWNTHFPINTLFLMRALTGMQTRHPQRYDQFLATIFEAMWKNGENMNDAAVIARVCEQAGFAADEILALAQDQATKDALRAATEEAVARGVFGAPTFFVGEQMFFGQDRLDFVREALA